MTHEEAGRIIMTFVKAYPTQARDEHFIGMMASALVGLDYVAVRARAWNWVKTEPFWPAIAHMKGDDEGPRPIALIAPANPIPTEQGLEILRSAIR